MKFSWQIADGMSYLSSKSVSHKYERHNIIVKIPCGASVMVSFSFMHTIWYLKNTPHRSKHILTVWFRTFSVGCTLQFSMLSPMFFCYYHHFSIFGWRSSCSLADVPHSRLILVSLTPLKFSIAKSSLIIERKFSPFLLETVSVLAHLIYYHLGL